MTEPSWLIACRTKKAQQAALLPRAWQLAAEPVDRDVSNVPLDSGLLSPRELAITSIDDCDQLLSEIASRRYSAAEVAIAFCKRATCAHQLTNCLTEILFDDAVARAQALDDHLARTGRPIGPLHGLPISLKDQFCIKGVECTMGFASWIGNISTEDCVLVQILREAGAVLYCRTNVPQTLMAPETDNHVFGLTVNPLNRTLTCANHFAQSRVSSNLSNEAVQAAAAAEVKAR